jgi:hypothetical protein
MCSFTFLTGFGLLAGAIARAQTSPDLEADWIFQCDQAPTYAKAKQEIVWAKEMAGRISTLKGAPDLSAPIEKLLKAEREFDSTAETPETAKLFYLAVRTAKRELAFKNPLLDFDKVALIDNPYPKGVAGDATDEWGHEARHRNGFMAVDGGRLLIVGLNPGGEVTDVLKGHTGSF